MTQEPAYTHLRSSSEHDALIDKYDNWLFDCDGVLYRGSSLIWGAKDFLSLLRAKGKKVLFVTNSASSSRAMYKKKFNDLGLDAEEHEIFGSAYAAAIFLSKVAKLPTDKKVFLIGERGLEEELKNEGIDFVCGTDSTYNVPPESGTYEVDPSIGAVLCGFDGQISYPKLARAYVQLASPSSSAKPIDDSDVRDQNDTLFLITNPDPTYPTSGGLNLPGAGALSAPLRYALGSSRPPIVLGKPARGMWECIQAIHQLDPVRTVMVGDRLDTDILFGRENGLGTLLVHSGVTTEEDLRPEADPLVLPDYVIDSLGDMCPEERRKVMT